MKPKLLLTGMAVAAIILGAGTIASDRSVTCKVCKMHGVPNAELACHQRAIAKTLGKQICPNCAGLEAAAKFSKDGTIFQGNPAFICSGCVKK